MKEGMRVRAGLVLSLSGIARWQVSRLGGLREDAALLGEGLGGREGGGVKEEVRGGARPRGRVPACAPTSPRSRRYRRPPPPSTLGDRGRPQGTRKRGVSVRMKRNRRWLPVNAHTLCRLLADVVLMHGRRVESPWTWTDRTRGRADVRFHFARPDAPRPRKGPSRSPEARPTAHQAVARTESRRARSSEPPPQPRKSRVRRSGRTPDGAPVTPSRVELGRPEHRLGTADRVTPDPG